MTDPVIPSFVVHDPFTLDLRDLMDTHYGPGNWTQRTAIGVGTDIGPALTDGLAALRQTFGRGKIMIPPGCWLMVNSPDPAVLSGHKIEGAGSMASVIVYNNPDGVAFYFNGHGSYSGGGIKGIGLMLESGLGNTTSYGILLNGDTVCQQDQTEFSDIYMTAIDGLSYWWDGFHADGTARSHPQGVRGSVVSNVQIFNCRNVGFYGGNLVQWTLTNVGTYTGTGPYGDMMIIDSGSVHVYGQGVNAALRISDTLDVMINGVRYS